MENVFKICLIGLILGAFLLDPLYPQTVDFNSGRWEISARESEVVDYMGRKSLRLKGGTARIKDAQFTNGIIEFDIAFSGERGFMGAMWRIAEPNNFEDFYFRPHQSGNPDANQYTPVFNGTSGWQLYHGEGFGAPVEYSFNEWMHVKIVISGQQGEVYIQDVETPAVFMPELKHELRAGGLGLKCSNLAPAYFSNYSFKAMDAPALKGAAKKPEAAQEGTIMSWAVSSILEEKSLDNKFRLLEGDKAQLTWKTLGCEEPGLANLARVRSRDGDKNTVFAKATIVSDKEQIRKLKFGYSDRVRLYFNDQLLYSGNNAFQSRDYRYLGTIGYFDEVYLPLREGKNELWMAVSETFGGWGIKAMFEDLSGIEIDDQKT